MQELEDVESLIKDGSNQVSQRNIKKAIVKYQEAYEIAKKSGKPDVLLSCACNLGAALLSQGVADPAIEYLENALKNSDTETTPMRNLFGDVRFNLGLAYSMKEHNHTAGKHFQLCRWAISSMLGFQGTWWLMATTWRAE